MSKNLPAQRELTLPPYDGRRSLRDDMDIMALPFFASEKGPAIRYMRAQINTDKDSAWVEIKGNDDGIATMWDKRLLIHIRTMIDEAIRRGETPKATVTFAPYDFFKAIGSGTGQTEYRNFEKSLDRLQGTTVKSSIDTDEVRGRHGRSWIQSYDFIESKTTRGTRRSGVRVTLSDWLFSKWMEEGKTLAVPPQYFKIRSGIEMRIYEICRKFVGNQDFPIRMNLALFHERLNASRGRTLDVKYAIGRIAKKGGILGYGIEVEEHRKRTRSDRVMVRMWKLKSAPRARLID